MLAPWPIGDKRTCRSDLCNNATRKNRVVTEKPKLLDTCGLKRIQALMGEVVRKTSKREEVCVYRGEPECYPIVSSGLYRKCPDSTNEAFDIARVEQEMTENARQHTTLTNDDEILAEIQHFGGSTNLIDFTDDYLIALFFASFGSDGKDGRVVLHWPDQDTVVRPKQTINRVVFQKSVLVRPQRGFIVPDPQDEIVVVPGDLKAGILSFLQRFHGTSERTVFNDIHGFIRHQTPDQSLYVGEFRQSLERPQRDTSQDLKFCLAMELITADLKNERHAFHQIGMVYENQKRSWLSLQSLTEPWTSYAFDFEPDELIELFTHLIDNKQSAMRAEQCIFWRGEAYLYLASSHPETHYLSFLKGCFLYQIQRFMGDSIGRQQGSGGRVLQMQFSTNTSPSKPPSIMASSDSFTTVAGPTPTD